MSAKKIRPELLVTAFLLAACQPGNGDADSDKVAAIPVETAINPRRIHWREEIPVNATRVPARNICGKGNTNTE